MAIAFDAAAQSASPSFSFTLGSGSNRIVVVGAGTENSNVTNVTFNGVNMTFSTLKTGFETRIEFWYMLEAQLPAAGTYTIAVTGGGAQDAHGASSWSGVDQSTPFGTIVTANGTSSPITVVVASATGEVVHDFLVSKDASSLVVGAGQTQRWNVLGGPEDDVFGGGSSEPGATSVTMSWTSSGTVGWATIGVPLKPATVSPPADPTGLVATCVASNQIDLAWTDNATDEDNYRVERESPVGGGFSEIAQIAADSTAFSDMTVLASTQYNYRVRACKTGPVCSGFSNESNCTTPAAVAGGLELKVEGAVAQLTRIVG